VQIAILTILRALDQLEEIRMLQLLMRRIAKSILPLLMLTVLVIAVAAANFPDTMVPLPSGWTGPVFHLSQNYPQQIPSDTYPWLQFDPKTQPDQYMQSVLQYCLDGNVEADWVLQANSKRGWYHAPWMHWGPHGREPIHGLTFERVSLPHELAAQQTTSLQNWAVGMYNAPGGYTIGRVWADPLKPQTSSAVFPLNTVSIKLLFTEGTPNQVPFLTGTKTWQAYVYTNPNNTDPGAPRVVKTLSLLQVDIAVRDSRVNDTTGWVFATFIYDGRNQGNSPYANLRPVGLMWGDDPGFGPAQAQQGAKPTETNLYGPTKTIMRHYGWLGRLNGPVDNPTSSCLSCHSTAQWPLAATMTPTNTPAGSSAWMQWFRNIPAGQPFSAGSASLDYSLQLATGLQNLAKWSNVCKGNPNAPVIPPCPDMSTLERSAGPAQQRIPTGFPVHR
jgi:hypothetical protein